MEVYPQNLTVKTIIIEQYNKIIILISLVSEATTRISLSSSTVAVTSSGALLTGDDVCLSTNGGQSKVQVLLVMVNETVSPLSHSEAVWIHT